MTSLAERVNCGAGWLIVRPIAQNTCQWSCLLRQAKEKIVLFIGEDNDDGWTEEKVYSECLTLLAAVDAAAGDKLGTEKELKDG